MKKKKNSAAVASVTEISFLHKFAIKAMKEYGTEVIENRAIADYRDGLKPVQRHSLWAMHSMSPRATCFGSTVKCSRIVGDIIGKYHPHGDLAAYGALVNMYWKNLPLIDKQGAFGSLSENAAAARYTEATLSKYSEEVFLNSKYLAVSDYFPNYDGQYQVPIVLPALLPNILLNGVEGIAVGVVSGIPSFDIEGVFKIVGVGLDREVTVKDCCKYLMPRLNGTFDCTVLNTADELKSFYETGIGVLYTEPKYVIDGNKLTITKFTPHFNPEKAIAKLFKIDEVMSAGDFSGKDVGDCFIITLKSSVTIMDRGTVFAECVAALKENMTLRLNVLDKVSETEINFHSWNMPQLINNWIKWRSSIEVKRANNDAKNLQKDIDRVNLFILACLNLDKIIPIIKANRPDVDERLAKALNITLEQAAVILQMTLRRLTGLSLQELNAELAKLKALLKQANIDIKQPTEAIKRGLDGLFKASRKALLVEANEGKSIK